MKLKNIFNNFIITICIILIIVFSYGIYIEWTSNLKNNNIKNSLIENITIKEESPEINAGANGVKDFDKDLNPVIFDPNKTNEKFIYADFNALKKENEDTVGWIWMPDTQINYPIVKTIDNNFYLKNNFNKEPNPGGWIYSDYRSTMDISDTNTVIYGHNRNDKSMFGELPSINKKWLENPEHKYIYISTPIDTRVYEIISVYSTPVNSYYIGHNFNTKEFEAFLSHIKDKNQIKEIEQSLNSNDKILTLSTCLSTNTRMVIHAKLIKNKTT